jgi:hypothetical protein
VSATKKMVLAMAAALAARPKNPNKAEINAMQKNAMAQENMIISYGDASLGQRTCQMDADHDIA